MRKNVVVGLSNERGGVVAYHFPSAFPSEEAMLLAEYHLARARLHRMMFKSPMYIFDAPDGAESFFDAEWNDYLGELFMYCQTPNGWDGAYRNNDGQTQRLPITQFADLWREWGSSDHTQDFVQFTDIATQNA